MVQLLDIQSLRSFLALRSPCRLNSKVKFADIQSVICPAVCTTHSLCHSNILSICSLSMRCKCLDRGCIQHVLFRFGSLKTALVINTSCSAHFLRSRRPLLLHLPTPSEPITLSQVWWSVPTLALKSPRRMSLSERGVAEIILSKSS